MAFNLTSFLAHLTSLLAHLTSSLAHDDFLPTQAQTIQQLDINDCIREFNLTREKGKYLISRVKGWNLLSPDIKFTYQRT